MGRHEDFATVNQWVDVVRRIQFGTRNKVAGRIIKNVCWALALYANADGSSIRPGTARLTFECEVDASTLKKVLAILREAGLIEVVEHARPTRGRPGSTQTVDVYQLTVADGVRESRRVVAGAPLTVIGKAEAKLAIVEIAAGRAGKYAPKHAAETRETSPADPADLRPETSPADSVPDEKPAGETDRENRRSAGETDADLRPETSPAYLSEHPSLKTTSHSDTASAVSGATALVLRHPTGEAAIVAPPAANAGVLLGAWIDHCRDHGMRLPKRTIGHYAKVIKEALDERFDEITVKRALALMRERGKAPHPHLLASFLVEVQQAPVVLPRQRRLTPGEDSARRLLAGEDQGQVIDAVNRFFERGAS